MRKVLLCLTLALGLPATAAEVEFYNGSAASMRAMPFSEAVRVGDLLIMSGILGTEERTDDLVEGGIIPETHQIFIHLKRVLEDHDLDFGNVVKCTVMLDDIEDYDSFNSVYATYFPGDKPARSAFAAEELALGATVELECWAAFPGTEDRP